MTLAPRPVPDTDEEQGVTLAPRPLHSKFGRRLLALFVGCALLPIGALAIVSYRHVKRQLYTESEARLHQANKAFGLAIFERLLLLDATLRGIPPRAITQIGRTSPSGPDWEANLTFSLGLDLLARRRFTALEFVEDGGTRTPVFRRLEKLPSIDTTQRAYLRSGEPLVLAHHAENVRPRIYMLRRLPRNGPLQGTLIGEISPKFLWSSLDEAVLSPTTRLTVVDDSGRVLYHSPFPSPSAAEAQPVTAEWPLVLEDNFGTPTWNLVLSQSEAEILAPMVEFTETFLGVLSVSILAVLLLSVGQIRRSLLPLVELQHGTRRITRRDFTTRVTVASRDEFAELATSFNTMASQLGKQFNALATAAEIDRAVLSATDATTVVDTVLARAADIFPCSLVGVILVAPESAKSHTCFINDYEHAGSRHAVRVDLKSPDVHALLTGPELTRIEATLSLSTYLTPLADLGATSFVVLPLAYQQQLSGIIVLAGRAPLDPSEDDLVQARRVADQAAVALANAAMLEQVRTLAYYDSLTGLPNRLAYKERLAQALEHAGRAKRLVAAFFIDLDHFSRINDTLGHEAGDQLLRQIATRLRSCCRERGDEVVPVTPSLFPEVARLGGDEFTILMPGLADPADAAKLARRILSSFAQPIELGAHELFVNASIGIAIYPFDGEDIDTLLMHADTAMYKAKEQGGSSYQIYAQSMDATALHRLTLENDLRRAIDREEFEAHYQPIIDALTGAVVGAEALLRWRHPELGLLLPSEFIPLAEENGLILPMGDWILRTACAQNHAWQQAGFRPIRVSVNLSSRQLTRTLPDAIGRMLAQSGLEPRYLGLELTESVLVAHQKESIETLHALRAMGVYLSVDDFGTGYSSFSYLKHFPLDALKIDRTFIRDIASDPDDAAITTAIVAMGHALGLKVVAEGVETAAHLDLLRRQGCDEAQGYLIGRPVAAEEFAAVLAHPRGARRRVAAGRY